MHESASRPLGTLVTFDADLDREFEDRLRESASLAVRVAYSVVRQRQDAEEVAQEAFAKAYSRFSQLRDRNSFPGVAGAHDLAAGHRSLAIGQAADGA